VNSMFTEATARPPARLNSWLPLRGGQCSLSGSWTAVRTNKARQTTAVDPHTGLPLIAKG
jgi:hypothetical protein